MAIIDRTKWLDLCFPTLTENAIKEKGKTALIASPKGSSDKQLMIISPQYIKLNAG